MSTPSLISDDSGASPSKVARSLSLSSAWRLRAKIAIICNPPIEVKDLFDKLYQLDEVPRTLAQVSIPCLHPEFHRMVRTWASTRTLQLVEGDEYGILPALPFLAFAYSRIPDTSKNQSKLDLAFSARLGCHCQFRSRESYRLVASAGNPDAESDTLVTMPSVAVSIKIQERRFQGDLTILEHLYWSTPVADALDDFSIIAFAGEFKKDDNDSNRNQLIMVLATAQAQRKALGLKPSIIMGAIAFRGKVQILSSYWARNESCVCIHEHEKRFDLFDPIQLLRFYFFV